PISRQGYAAETSAMRGEAASFIGDIPEYYDSGLGPMIFVDYAVDIARRAAACSPALRQEFGADPGRMPLQAIDVTDVLQTSAESGDHRRGLTGRPSAEPPDYRHRRLLRACCERPGRRAAEQSDEIASFHAWHGLPGPCSRFPARSA